jgi:hypothetical protein
VVEALGNRFLERFTGMLGRVRSARMRYPDIRPYGTAWD